ncbi:hypothetical protein KIPB_009354 [Kipferlia bialata]|uniref:POPLD domain-containing protein n=1 Tax=Kipferlia bialata TaxID=797122 RepID=A0A9K3D3U4_9EUKA|nr:hypothetical protein KIPB_009354 [Kipferlia bialata]|eukprot:g9354.t1
MSQPPVSAEEAEPGKEVEKYTEEVCQTILELLNPETRYGFRLPIKSTQRGERACIRFSRHEAVVHDSSYTRLIEVGSTQRQRLLECVCGADHVLSPAEGVTHSQWTPSATIYDPATGEDVCPVSVMQTPSSVWLMVHPAAVSSACTVLAGLTPAVPHTVLDQDPVCVFDVVGCKGLEVVHRVVRGVQSVCRERGVVPEAGAEAEGSAEERERETPAEEWWTAHTEWSSITQDSALLIRACPPLLSLPVPTRDEPYLKPKVPMNENQLGSAVLQAEKAADKGQRMLGLGTEAGEGQKAERKREREAEAETAAESVVATPPPGYHRTPLTEGEGLSLFTAAGRDEMGSAREGEESIKARRTELGVTNIPPLSNPASHPQTLVLFHHGTVASPSLPPPPPRVRVVVPHGYGSAFMRMLAGHGARAIGLEEWERVQQDVLGGRAYPSDWPGTQAGAEERGCRAEAKVQQWLKMPPSKRASGAYADTCLAPLHTLIGAGEGVDVEGGEAVPTCHSSLEQIVERERVRGERRRSVKTATKRTFRDWLLSRSEEGADDMPSNVLPTLPPMPSFPLPSPLPIQGLEVVGMHVTDRGVPEVGAEVTVSAESDTPIYGRVLTGWQSTVNGKGRALVAMGEGVHALEAQREEGLERVRVTWQDGDMTRKGSLYTLAQT